MGSEDALSVEGTARSDSEAVPMTSQDQQPSIDPDASELPEWYTPKRLLGLFCGVSFLVYLDRGVIACNEVNGNATSGIQVGRLSSKANA